MPIQRPVVMVAMAYLALWLPELAWADNCGSLRDCFDSLRAALAALVAVGTFAVFLSLALDFLPVIGTVKGIFEFFTGRDLVTGEKLAEWERWLGIIPILGVFTGGSRAAARAGRGFDSLLGRPPRGTGYDWRIVTLPAGTKLYGVGALGKPVRRWGAFREESLLDYARGNQWKPTWGWDPISGGKGSRTPIVEYSVTIRKPLKVWAGKIATQSGVKLPHLGGVKIQYYHPTGLGVPVEERILGWVPRPRTLWERLLGRMRAVLAIPFSRQRF